MPASLSFRVLLAAAALAVAAPASAALTVFTDRDDWLAAAGGTPTLLTFEEIAPATSLSSGSTTATAIYDPLGITFRAFTNGQFPLIQTGSGAVTTSGTRWLGNFPAMGFDEANNGIGFSFLPSALPVRSFAFFDVASPGQPDGFTVRAYDADNGLVGSGTTQESGKDPLFWGFVADTNIARVTITPRSGNGYIGIDNLEFVPNVPEPSTWALLLGGLVGAGFAVRRARGPLTRR